MSRARSSTRALAAVALLTLTLLPGAVVAAPTPSPSSTTSSPSSSTGATPTADPTDSSAGEATPLTVELASLSPSVLPRRGAVRMQGTVTNSSEEEWSDVNVAPFSSTTPMTTRDEVALAAQTDEAATVGERLDDAGTFVSLGDLAPGERLSFSLRVPVSELPISGDPGVYWIGVHALGTSSAGRDSVADGRARTFVPLVSRARARATRVPVSVVLPLREPARRAADASLAAPQRWVRLTGDTGRLARLADFADSAGDDPLTWVADPAVLDAVGDLAQGNPSLSLGGRRRVADPDDGDGSDGGSDGGSGGGSASGSPSPSASPTPRGDGDAGAGIPSEADSQAARALLTQLVDSLREHDLLTLGYADPDAAGLARRSVGLLERSWRLAARRMGARDLEGPLVVAPPSGFFDSDLLGRLPSDAELLLGDNAELDAPVASRTVEGQRLTLTDARASSGGPAPTSPTDPLALRQRLLSETALEAGSGADPRPVVLALPERWDPGARWREADFFGGLDVPWLRLAPLPRGETTYDAALPYPRSEEDDEIRATSIDVARGLVGAALVLDGMLANDNDVLDRLLGASLQSVSYAARSARGATAAQAIAMRDAAQREIDRVAVTGTDFVTLSSGAGEVTVTLVNGLEQPVTVGLRAATDGEVSVETPDPVDLGPGQRYTMRLPVRSPEGVHSVTLQPVTLSGADAGQAFTFALRTSQVGIFIWVVIAAGGLLLAVMIARRIVLRVREHRWRRAAG
ncbi:hypothetical protein SAMN04488570_2934 [Nocardioides scoriae]|uniref:Glycoprotein n=1 Tax=Nocardioides scoriae TaxID=642780 RepID=A0A1H1VSX2_9ACTN|nr:DUF6049 family protein [Nocardioides scoriae]SDS88034.1 hypothetical protein SAMN04488570_2934 [Nocardioides scoriae]